jgi:hypothetical protein
MVAGHGASIAKEVKHFMKVADCRLCRGGVKRGEAVTYVRGRAVESDTGQVRDWVSCQAKGTADGAIEGG